MLILRRDLPTGTPEANDLVRLESWAKVQDKAAALMGVVSHGLDPDISFSDPQMKRYGAITLTPEAAVALAGWYDQLEALGAMARPRTPSVPLKG